MNASFYDFETSSDNLRFEFDSIGIQKQIRKVVQYTPLTQNSDVFNLGFGDLKPDGSINDLVVSDNQDMEMVLSTVVQTLVCFFEFYPKKAVFFVGSTPSRTRLYQIIITKFLLEIEKSFYVRGIRNGEMSKFVSNLKYEAFLITVKPPIK